jgi:hypothetical protein
VLFFPIQMNLRCRKSWISKFQISSPFTVTGSPHSRKWLCSWREFVKWVVVSHKRNVKIGVYVTERPKMTKIETETCLIITSAIKIEHQSKVKTNRLRLSPLFHWMLERRYVLCAFVITCSILFGRFRTSAFAFGWRAERGIHTWP